MVDDDAADALDCRYRPYFTCCRFDISKSHHGRRRPPAFFLIPGRAEKITPLIRYPRAGLLFRAFKRADAAAEFNASPLPASASPFAQVQARCNDKRMRKNDSFTRNSCSRY